ncbi:unnamed protein product [Urochloa humidicola]
MASLKLLLLLSVMLIVSSSRTWAAEDDEAYGLLHHGHGRRGRRGRRIHPSPAPPSPAQPAPAPPQPPQCGCCELCRAIPCDGFVSAPPGAAAGTGAPAGSSAAFSSCFAALSGMSSCMDFLTGSAQATPGRQSSCCRGLGEFLDGAASEGDRELRCICPLIGGQVNQVVPSKPVSPIRVMMLPVACGRALPAHTFALCLNTTMAADIDEIKA